MSIDSENTSTPTTEAPATKGRKPAKKAKPAKKGGRAKSQQPASQKRIAPTRRRRLSR